LAIDLAKVNDVSPARRVAFEILQRVSDGGFSSTLLAAREPELEPLDRALCHELVMGVLRWQLQLDKVIEYYAKRNIGDLDLPVLLALRLGLYQLRFLSRIPASAAVNESVNLVGRARLKSAQAFVNAVLRRATREPEYDPVTGVQDLTERIAIQTSHPVWLIERWAQSFGLAETELLAMANNQTPATSFRVVHSRSSESDVLTTLRSVEAEPERSSVATGAWRIAGNSSLLRKLAAEGVIYFQDEASQLLAQVIDARPGERVLDLCAAPGGKTTHLADLTDDRAVIVGADISARRLQTIADAVSLQQLKSVDLIRLDAGKPLPFAEKSFDHVLVDAPCSGTGTLRRNAEIRWRITPSTIQELSVQQQLFLSTAAKVVKSGGRLVYSTCSLELEENEQVVHNFLKGIENFKQIPAAAATSQVSESGAVRTWPQHQGTDGFFIAVFERTDFFGVR
jgi:16S rRNA (cytosine967-C5)-methyltransferase